MSTQAKSRLYLVSQNRIVSYAILSACLFLLAFATYGVHWDGSQQLHSLLELSSTLVAFFIGVMALSMYRADKKQTSLLILSLGFFGTAVLDGYHCFATTTAFAYLFPSSIESLVPWSWHASRTYFSIFVCLALWVTGKRELQRTQMARLAIASAATLTLACFVFFAFCPLPPAYFSGPFGGRPQEYIPAVFFLLALFGHLRSGEWAKSRLEHWYVLSLIVSVATQAIFMSQSHAIFDCMFDLSHLLKIVSYVFVGAGLTLSMSDFFRSAEEAKLLAFAVDHSQHGIAVLNHDSKIEFMNRGFERLTGFCRDDLLGTSIDRHLAKKSQKRAWEKLVRSRQEETGCEVEVDCLKNSGESFWASLELRPVTSAPGTIEQYILFLRDISEQRRAEEEKEKLNEELLSVSRQVGMSEIATGTLHNVGNVLNSVNVSVALILENLNQSQLKNMNRMVEVVSSQDDLAYFITEDSRGKNFPKVLTEIVDNLNGEHKSNELELQSLAESVNHIKQIVAMQQSFAKVGGVNEKLDITELLQDAIKMHEGGITRHHIEVAWELTEEIPLVSTDRHKVLQILVNFIGNAKQAMSDNAGERRLKITVRKDDDELSVYVQDNGRGISPENLPKIFGHGFTTKPKGHGFGLHSSVLAAKDLGGSLSVQSDGEGCGATFTLRLPLTPALAEDTRSTSTEISKPDEAINLVKSPAP